VFAIDHLRSILATTFRELLLSIRSTHRDGRRVAAGELKPEAFEASRSKTP
jgi:hypothetical protein